MASEIFTVVGDFADFLAVNKAPGFSVHRDRNSRGFVDQVAEFMQCERLYLVHRLDRMTSGLLLLAKSSESCAALAGLFAQRKVEKYYVALSDSRPQKKQGLVQGDMERSRNGCWKLTRTRTDPAITRFFSSSVSPGLRLFVLRPETGKTHQLRVAMKSLGAPILGDARYGGAEADRGYLHAYALRFEYGGTSIVLQNPPVQGEMFERDDVREAMQLIEPPWALPWAAKTRQSNDAGS